MSRSLPVSVVVPTVGRPELLRSLLDSLSRCEPGPDEIVVAAESSAEGMEEVVASHARARVIYPGAGGLRGRNLGFEAARNEVVMGTDDDCTVAADWIGRGWAHLEGDPDALVTGRFLPAGDPERVPSVRDDDVPREFARPTTHAVLYPGNMAVRRVLALELGGFDDRLFPAEDNDFCYRWLRSGRRIRYEPDLIVWHHAWRTREEVVDQYRNYARAQGLFYAKHLRRRDPRMLFFLGLDLKTIAAAQLRRLVRGSDWTDWRAVYGSGLSDGLRQGWREFRASSAS